VACMLHDNSLLIVIGTIALSAMVRLCRLEKNFLWFHGQLTVSVLKATPSDGRDVIGLLSQFAVTDRTWPATNRIVRLHTLQYVRCLCPYWCVCVRVCTCVYVQALFLLAS
jgi:hypothetical protein